MPSTSPAQAHLMNAIAHGWHPPKDSKVASIPLAVAQDYVAADQARRTAGSQKERVAKALMGKR